MKEVDEMFEEMTYEEAMKALEERIEELEELIEEAENEEDKSYYTTCLEEAEEELESLEDNKSAEDELAELNRYYYSTRF
jgi:hypothetical protein